MELVILIALVIAVLGFFLWRDRKYEESGSHPLDSVTKPREDVPYKVEPPVLTTKVDGIGHEAVEVPTKQAKQTNKPKSNVAAKPKPKKAQAQPAKTTKAPAKTTKAPAKPKKAPKK
jgi:hypothetical protein